MALKRPPKAAQMTLNLAPMVDVMMCLIIFFLIASKLVEAEQYPVELPWAIAAKEVDRSELGAVVTINVRRAGERGDQAEFVVADWDGQRVTERVLQPGQVERLLQARATRAAAAKQKLRCAIRADRLVMYRHVEAVLRACGLANISDIVFSANAGEEPEEPG